MGPHESMSLQGQNPLIISTLREDVLPSDRIAKD